jgi:hypothetical protein
VCSPWSTSRTTGRRSVLAGAELAEHAGIAADLFVQRVEDIHLAFQDLKERGPFEQQHARDANPGVADLDIEQRNALTCENMVGPVGLEPTTYGLKVRSSAWLS